MAAGPALAVTYLTFDSLAEGVGASQVLPYVEGLAALGVAMTVHSFERDPGDAGVRRRLAAAGVEWRPHRFRSGGAAAGAARVVQGAALVRGAPLAHARSDLPAASCLLARVPFVWDVRSFWAEQRIAQGSLRAGSRQARVLAAIENGAARRSAAITALTSAAIEELAARHGPAIRDKATVVPTCVDLERFPLVPPSEHGAVRLLLSGSFNALYDRDSTFALVDALAARTAVALRFLRPDPSPWDDDVAARGGSITSARYDEMPEHVAWADAGLCVLRPGNRLAAVGAAPTKLAEFLATGRPIVVSAGLGDFDRIVADHGCGVVLPSAAPDDIEQTVTRLLELVADPEVPGRCRAAAESTFDLADATRSLLRVYKASTRA